MADIQLVIEIPEEKYNYVKKQVAEGIDNPLKVYIANGTPLPKGHGKIVDANRVLENGDNWEVETALMQTEAIIEADKATIEDAIIEEAEEYEADLDNCN